MLEKNEAALKIQSFFGSYRLKKQVIAQQVVASSPASKLLQAFDLRFQCMRAVAAAKFPINKPIEDPAQVTRVIASIRKIAEEKGITNLDAIERLFHQNIVLAERIQAPYYYMIWRTTYQDGVNTQRLINNAYKQLCDLVQTSDLPIIVDSEKTYFESNDILSLAREVIQFASKTIIDVLADAEQFSSVVLQEEFSDTFEKMLSVYMSPRFLSKSKENIPIMIQDINHCYRGCSR